MTLDGQPVEFEDGVQPGRDIYGLYEGLIRDAFDGWDNLPDPVHFDAPIRGVGDAAWRIAISASSGRVEDVANPEMRKIQFMLDELVQMEGEVVTAFTEDYAYLLPSVVAGQYAMAVLADFALESERELWDRARTDITAVAESGLEAMRQARYQGGGGSLKALLSVVGAVASIAGVFVTGGAAAPILGGVGKITGALGTLLPSQEPPAPPELPLWADTASACWGNVYAAIVKLRETILAAEDELVVVLDQALGFVSEHLRSFDLTAPVVIDEDDPDDVTRGVLAADLPTLRSIGEKTMPTIAGQLTVASDEAGKGASGTPWWRPPSTGLTNDEAFLNYSLLLAEFCRVTDDTAWELREAGEVLVLAVKDLTASDEESRRDMDRHRRHVEEGSPYADSPLTP